MQLSQFVIAGLLAVSVPAAGQHTFTSQIVASDIDRFWIAFEAFDKDTTQNPFVKYVEAGSPGISDMNQQMIHGAEKLKKHVAKRMEFYREARAITQTWNEYRDKIDYVTQEAVRKIPGFNLSNVYLVIGIENCGATLTGNGVIVGLETLSNSGKLPDPLKLSRSMENLPEMIIGTMMWTNMALAPNRDLMNECLAHGVADYISEQLVRDLKIKNPFWKSRTEYGQAHLCELWNAFVAERTSENLGNWFWKYDLPTPPNLGNFIGYYIAQEYVSRHTENPAILQDLLKLDQLRIFAEVEMVPKSCGAIQRSR